MKNLLFVILLSFITLNCAGNDEFNPALILNEWQIVSLSNNGQPVTLTSVNRYKFFESGDFIYTNISSNPSDTLIEYGFWNIGDNSKILNLDHISFSMSYEIKSLTSNSMSWRLSSEEGIAIIDLKSSF